MKIIIVLSTESHGVQNLVEQSDSFGKQVMIMVKRGRRHLMGYIPKHHNF